MGGQLDICQGSEVIAQTILLKNSTFFIKGEIFNGAAVGSSKSHQEIKQGCFSGAGGRGQCRYGTGRKGEGKIRDDRLIFIGFGDIFQNNRFFHETASFLLIAAEADEQKASIKAIRFFQKQH